MNKLIFVATQSKLSIRFSGLLVSALCIAVAFVPTANAQFVFEDVNPSNSNLDPTDPDGATGGRVNGLAAVAGDNSVFYAASEWGGIYKSIDGGVTWIRLDAHNPNGAWDVEVNSGATLSLIHI